MYSIEMYTLCLSEVLRYKLLCIVGDLHIGKHSVNIFIIAKDEHCSDNRAIDMSATLQLVLSTSDVHILCILLLQSDDQNDCMQQSYSILT